MCFCCFKPSLLNMPVLPIRIQFCQGVCHIITQKIHYVMTREYSMRVGPKIAIVAERLVTDRIGGCNMLQSSIAEFWFSFPIFTWMPAWLALDQVIKTALPCSIILRRARTFSRSWNSGWFKILAFPPTKIFRACFRLQHADYVFRIDS